MIHLGQLVEQPPMLIYKPSRLFRTQVVQVLMQTFGFYAPEVLQLTQLLLERRFGFSFFLGFAQHPHQLLAQLTQRHISMALLG
jgi:hypothetical protein